MNTANFRSNLVAAVLTVLLGGAGVPSAAQQMSQPILRAAPERCLLFAGWTGAVKIDETGAATERWLAQPEIQDTILHLKTAISQYLEKNPTGEALADELIRELPWLMLRQPFCIYLAEIDLEQESVSAGGILGLGDREDWMRQWLQSATEKYNAVRDDDQRIQTVKVDGHQLFTIEAVDQAPRLHFGIIDSQLVVAVGQNAIDELLANRKTDSPQWLNTLHKELPTERLAGLFRVDANRLWQMAMANEAPIPGFLGLNEIEEVMGVMDVRPDNMLTQLFVRCPERTEGVLSVMDVEPLNRDQVSEIPADVASAYAFRLSIDRAWKLINQLGEEVDLAGLGEFVNNVEQDTGLNFEQEILGSFDGTFYNYGSVDLINPTGGLIVSLGIKDPKVFPERFRAVNEAIQDLAEFEGDDYEQNETNGVMVHSLETGSLAVYWCQVEKQLLLALDRGAIRSHLRKRKREGGKLVDNERIKQMFAAEGRNELGPPIGLTTIDYADFFQVAMPGLAMAFGEMTPHPDFDFSMQDLPSAEVLAKGISPTVTALYRTNDGFKVVESHTLPGNASVAVTGVAIGMLLPAVQQVRHAARRAASSNNMRQLCLALLLHESEHLSFPRAFTKNDAGEELLSWRVHLLPYLEHQGLYEKFHLEEPWDSPHNKQLIDQMPTVFAHPALSLDAGLTCYLGVSGDDGILSAPTQPSNDGKMTAGVTLEQLTDGTANTIAMVEVNEENATVWTRPNDFEPAKHRVVRRQLSDIWGEAVVPVGLADGSIHTLGVEITDEQFRWMMNKSDGRVVDIYRQDD